MTLDATILAYAREQLTHFQKETAELIEQSARRPTDYIDAVANYFSGQAIGIHYAFKRVVIYHARDSETEYLLQGYYNEAMFLLGDYLNERRFKCQSN